MDYRFSHEVTLADENHVDEIEQFMMLADPRMNPKWVRVAYRNGERCFMVRLGEEVAGVGWVSLVNRIGRLHSFYVKPRFRKLGIGQDLRFARFLWLKSKKALSVFSEISRNNFQSSRLSFKSGMRVSGQVYQYFKNKAQTDPKISRPKNTSLKKKLGCFRSILDEELDLLLTRPLGLHSFLHFVR
jgi:hypothetical protein